MFIVAALVGIAIGVLIQAFVLKLAIKIVAKTEADWSDACIIVVTAVAVSIGLNFLLAVVSVDFPGADLLVQLLAFAIAMKLLVDLEWAYGFLIAVVMTAIWWVLAFVFTVIAVALGLAAGAAGTP